jgi:hypothetical protein
MSSAPAAAMQHSPSFAPPLRTVNSLLIIVDIGEKILIKTHSTQTTFFYYT